MSSLASQLAGLAKANQQAAPGKAIRGKPSLLFDFAKAADLDLQTIYHIGCEGKRRLHAAWSSPPGPLQSEGYACLFGTPLGLD